MKSKILLCPFTMLTIISYLCSLIIWLFSIQYDGGGLYLYLIMFATGVFRTLSDIAVSSVFSDNSLEQYRLVSTFVISFMLSAILDFILRSLKYNLGSRVKEK